ncbi:uncharacterized protein [Dermacentor albipictus]
MTSRAPQPPTTHPGQPVHQVDFKPPVQSPTLPEFPVTRSRRVKVAPVAPSATGTATLRVPQAPFPRLPSLRPVAPSTPMNPFPARMAQERMAALGKAQGAVTAAQVEGRRNLVAINPPLPKETGSRPAGRGVKTASREDYAATGEADLAGIGARRLQPKAQRPEEPETLWERWWPFAFAMSPPERDEFATKEINKRRRERLRKLRKYDEGRDFEQFTDSNLNDSSQGSMDEQIAAPETPAGHYSKAHPYYKKLRLPSGRRVDITRRNYFLRKWRDKKIKTSYETLFLLGALVVLICLVIYAYKENMPWLYNILSGLRDVARGTKDKKRVTNPMQLDFQWRAGTTAEQYDDDTTDDFDAETTSPSEYGIGTQGVVFAKDDMRRRLV